MLVFSSCRCLVSLRRCCLPLTSSCLWRWRGSPLRKTGSLRPVTAARRWVRLSQRKRNSTRRHNKSVCLIMCAFSTEVRYYISHYSFNMTTGGGASVSDSWPDIRYNACFYSTTEDALSCDCQYNQCFNNDWITVQSVHQCVTLWDQQVSSGSGSVPDLKKL